MYSLTINPIYEKTVTKSPVIPGAMSISSQIANTAGYLAGTLV